MLAYHAALVGLLVGTTLLGTVLGILNVRHGAREVRANAEWLTDRLGIDEPMADALAGLARENLANPFPHPWYAAFNHRHPPIPERMRYVRTVDSAEETDVETAQNPA